VQAVDTERKRPLQPPLVLRECQRSLSLRSCRWSRKTVALSAGQGTTLHSHERDIYDLRLLRQRVDPNDAGVTYGAKQVNQPGFGQEIDIIDGEARFFHLGLPYGCRGIRSADAARRGPYDAVAAPRRELGTQLA
jgi:hypothetical protein